MKIKKNTGFTCLLSVRLFCFIKNASSAIRYASDAIDLCLEMIVPTLFRFLYVREF